MSIPEGASTISVEGSDLKSAIAAAATELGVESKFVGHKLDLSHFRSQTGGMIPRDTVKIIAWQSETEVKSVAAPKGARKRDDGDREERRGRDRDRGERRGRDRGDRDRGDPGLPSHLSSLRCVFIVGARGGVRALRGGGGGGGGLLLLRSLRFRSHDGDPLVFHPLRLLHHLIGQVVVLFARGLVLAELVDEVAQAGRGEDLDGHRQPAKRFEHLQHQARLVLLLRFGAPLVKHLAALGLDARLGAFLVRGPVDHGHHERTLDVLQRVTHEPDKVGRLLHQAQAPVVVEEVLELRLEY